MDVSLGRVLIAQDVKFDESTLDHQLLTTKASKITLEPAEHDKDSEIEGEPPKPPKATVLPPKAMGPSPKAMIQSPKAMVQTAKATALPHAINPIDISDDDLTPPPETPPLKPRRSGRTAAKVSIAMMLKQGPETDHAALDAEDAEQ